MNFITILAKEFNLRPEHVQAVIEMLDAGNTIPFIARYRKEKTGSMDDQLLRDLAERLEYLRNLEKRREEIAKALEEQGVLTDELTLALQKAQTLAELEDIYRPFRPSAAPGPPSPRNGDWNPWPCGCCCNCPRGT